MPSKVRLSPLDRATRVRGKAKGWRIIMPNNRHFKASLVKKFKAGKQRFALLRYF